MGDENNYLLKLNGDKPFRGMSHAKTEKLIGDMLEQVRLGERRLLEAFYNCEIKKEGEITVTLKANLGTVQADVYDTLELRYRAKEAIERVFGIGFGDAKPSLIQVPNSLLVMLGLKEKPEDFKDLNKSKRDDWLKEMTEIPMDQYENALKLNGVLTIHYITDLDKQKKDV
jgi:hypothetical protein